MFSIVVLFIALYIFANLAGVFGNEGFKQARTISFREAKYLITLCAKVVKSDGHINETEAELITQILDDLARKSGGDREELKRVFSIEKNNLENVRQVALEYNKFAKLTPNRKTGLIYFFLNIAYIDGRFDVDEKRIIGEIANGFGINEIITDQIFAMFEASYYGNTRENSNRSYDRNYRNSYNRGEYRQGNSGYSNRYNEYSYKKEPEFDPYSVLELQKNATFDEIKKKYRELVKKYHPDILMGKGADDEIVQEGTKKLQEINKAYEILKEKFGEK